MDDDVALLNAYRDTNLSPEQVMVLREAVDRLLYLKSIKGTPEYEATKEEAWIALKTIRHDWKLFEVVNSMRRYKNRKKGTR